MTVRVAVARVHPGDERALNELRALLAAYDGELPADLGLHDLPRELAGLAEKYASGALFIARDGEVACGCVVLNHRDDEHAEIKRLYVAPHARGTGLGRRLVLAAVGEARERGYARVVLDTQPERLAPAYALYCSLGFRACAPYETAEYGDPIYMELRLAAAEQDA